MVTYRSVSKKLLPSSFLCLFTLAMKSSTLFSSSSSPCSTTSSSSFSFSPSQTPSTSTLSSENTTVVVVAAFAVIGATFLFTYSSWTSSTSTMEAGWLLGASLDWAMRKATMRLPTTKRHLGLSRKAVARSGRVVRRKETRSEHSPGNQAGLVSSRQRTAQVATSSQARGMDSTRKMYVHRET